MKKDQVDFWKNLTYLIKQEEELLEEIVTEKYNNLAQDCPKVNKLLATI